MDYKKDFLGHNFTWFIGEVEDRNDPLRLGRVKVRCFGWHSSDKELQPTKNLPWANTVQPVTAPATSASGLTKGVWVFGFFLDGNKAQRPIVLGHLPGYRFGSPGESELPKAARQEADYPAPGDTLRASTQTEDVIIDPENDVKWSEPAAPSDAAYPTAMVQAHESGTYTQIAGSGRYTIQSNGGGYFEIDAGGNGKWKVVTDKYEITGGNDFVNVGGTVNLTVAGDVNWNIGGNWSVNVGGDVTHNIGGSVSETIGAGQTTNVAGTQEITAGKTEIKNNVEITGTSTASVDHISAGISGKNHTHTDTPGLGAGTTSSPQ